MTHIFLYGPPGVGKTCVGRELAQDLALPFIDLDQAIEKETGMAVDKFVESRGLDSFRDIETGVLKTVLEREDHVIALGGGTLLLEENQVMVEKCGRVVVLMAEPEILVQRLASDPNKRPLLAGDLRQRLSTLCAERAKHYHAFTTVLPAGDRTPQQNAEQIQITLGRFHLSAMGAYDVVVQPHSLEQIGALLHEHGLDNPLVVSDENVTRLHSALVMDSLIKKGFSPALITLPAGEQHKSLETITSLWHGFIEKNLDRKSTVIALGGGVVSDLAGFAASTYMRGVSWVVVPTTLLSMVDASLGGKTGFDLPAGKNLIGAFHPPRCVLIDPQVLTTLPEHEFTAGMAEVVKAGVIADPDLFAFCARGLARMRSDPETIIKRALAVKVRIIEQDPYERGCRAALNFGHTLGHAIELVSGYKIGHGQAVAIGMVAETRLAERLSIAPAGLSYKVAETLEALHLPTMIPNELPKGELIQAMRRDKKKIKGIVHFSLPLEIGRVELVDVQDLEMIMEEQ